MKNLLLTLLSLLLLVACARQAAQQSEQNRERPRRTEILFLGDRGHHRPAERVPSLMAALGNRGINLTYTDNLADLNPETLSKYDGLLIYANWDSLPPAQEKALLDYVASGKGLIPVHCASFCFRNSEEYVKMVGGQFWRHRMDTIQPVFKQTDHPVMMGVQKFKVYDETYLHSKLQPDNNVLTEREIRADQAKDKPGQSVEPYTWTRSYGKGRVFYTAYGHDERTWDNPGFQKLLENGILWAVGDQVKALHDGLNPQPFAFREANLPNYEKRPGPQQQQLALSPEESMKHIQVPVDFNLDLYASEPNVMHPIAMTWDERGRLYVLITRDYPNERKETGGSDYILLCEDTNKDGKADKFTRWAEGLSIPTGMVAYNGGLIVSQAPHMLYLRDANGDDKADERKVLFTGFGTYDTHAGPSNLHYGFDNWIWGSVGYSGFRGKVGADSVKFGQGFFRFRPDGSQLEFVTATSNNTWGFAFNETGDVFGSTANNSHGWYMAIPNRNFLSATGRPDAAVDNGSRSTDSHKDMKPITGKVRQVDVFGGFTAAAGHNFYTARAFPKPYWNRVAFVCEPTGHIVHQNVMEKRGTNYEDTELVPGSGFNLLAGADEWVSPVFAEVGPDGAVWVADWYSFIIQHNPTPKGAKNGSGNAYETDLRDFTHGRIYRVSYKKAPAYQPLSLSKDRPQELVAALKNNNMFWRQTAQRLLVERGQKDVVPQLVELVKDKSVDEIGINPAAIHALWTLQGLGVELSPEVVTAGLTHPCAGVRKTTVQVMPRTAASVEPLLSQKMLEDKEPVVVLNSLLALTEMPLTPASEKALLARFENAKEVDDRWMPDAFAVVLNSHGGKLRRSYLAQVAQKGSSEQMAGTNGHHDHAAMSAGTNSKATEATASFSGDKPDLAITGIRMEPAKPALRENVRLVVDIQNRGGAALPAGTVVPMNMRIQGEGRLVNLTSVQFTKGLASGEKGSIEQGNNGPWVGPLSFGSDQPGTFTISAVLDRENGIAESNENNNSFTTKLVYEMPKNLTAYALERAIRSYVAVQPVDSAVAMLRLAGKLAPEYGKALTKGVLDGWNPRRRATVAEADKAFVASLTQSLPDDSRERMSRLLPAWGVQSLEKEDPNVQVIRIKAVREAMQFDKKEFSVTAGKPVEIILENPDAMQHNLVIGQPGTTNVIGAAADKMITAKDGAEKNYVPAIPQVVAASPLVNPDQTYRLKFIAPAKPGDYPFVCTFPGHWRLMNGVMKVVAETKGTAAR
ncbi:PVC-type heme-binding CxxCH protein [Tellurirhabdus rosea]|uniref:PVC-type heme-binding CxxCH protein n=1 Tax=Tellurirhabdus rosea TaxID=2674997 RepID=UPI002252D367|nr:PVC-type heme-binding CxxCH protein [Tellurirhabdus rosea]